MTGVQTFESSPNSHYTVEGGAFVAPSLTLNDQSTRTPLVGLNFVGRRGRDETVNAGPERVLRCK